MSHSNAGIGVGIVVTVRDGLSSCGRSGRGDFELSTEFGNRLVLAEGLINHTPAAVSHSFDDENLTATTGLVPIMALAHNAGLFNLADESLTVTTSGADRGSNPAPKPATPGRGNGTERTSDVSFVDYVAPARNQRSLKPSVRPRT